MEKVQLKNICRPKQWKTLTGKNLVPDGKYPVYGANGIIGYYNDYNHENETLMIGCRGTCGALNISQPFSYINGNAMALDDLVDDIDIRYLYYALMGRGFQDVISGAVQPQIIRADLEKMEVWIGNKKEQKEIVDVFSKLDAVLSHRKREIQYLDDLIKARFIELFGNPLDGTAKYPIHQVGEVANSVDPQPSHRTPPIDEDGIPYVSTKDCDYKTGKIDFEGARKVSRGVLEEHLNRYTLHDGDFIIGKIGTIGKPVFVPAREDYTLSANVVLVQPNSDLVSPYFLKYSFESDFVERQFAEAKNSTSQAAFGIQKVRTVKVMNPNLNIQRGFEDFVKQIDKSKATVQKALDETQLLFDSLMQQYFG